MKCEHLGERLVDLWDEELDDAARDELELHVAECEICRDELEELEPIWSRLGEIDPAVEVPSDRLRSRFYAFLAEEQSRRTAPGWWRRLTVRLGALWPQQPALQAAMVAAALFVGVGVGATVGDLGTGSEIEALRTELESVSETVSLSLITHPAASERLRGVSLSQGAVSDERIINGLLQLVSEDPSINVRLAAIEALAARLDEPGVKPRLVRTLADQSSPLLQMTLLDVLLPADGRQVLEAAEPLLEGDDLDEAVRERLLAARGDSA